MHTLLFMGQPDHAEQVRCRIYDGSDNQEQERVAFIRSLAGPGVIDCEAYDTWVAALQERGWLPEKPDIEPDPNGGDFKVGRWRLTEAGRQAVAELLR